MFTDTEMDLIEKHYREFCKRDPENVSPKLNFIEGYKAAMKDAGYVIRALDSLVENIKKLPYSKEEN
jgi:hypothetical protein